MNNYPYESTTDYHYIAAPKSWADTTTEVKLLDCSSIGVSTADLVNTDDLLKEVIDKIQRIQILHEAFNWKHLPIKKVIFNKPATVVIWDDGEKTVVKCGEKDEYDEEKGLAMAIVKRLCGNKGRYNEEFKKWIPERQTKKQSAKEKLMQAADEYVKSVMGDTDG